MALRVYNTLTREKEPFTPVTPGRVSMYVCGITVYKSPHIGHMVGPVIFDAIKRYLEHRNFKVTWVVNITDVDDKIIATAQKTGATAQAVAERYTKEYIDCLALLGVDTIDHFPKVSDHMPEIIALTQNLIDRGFAYAAEGSVYFDVTKDDDYGKLSHRRVEQQEAGTRDVETSGKRNPADFALWKAAKPGEPAWDSPWGPGRPGWHIECSAMSMKYLGETLDIHGGGMDLIFPHHENELAQSESATGKPFAKVWMHNGLTRIKTKVGAEWKEEKMSGSIGNVVSARDLVEQYGPDLVRYFLLSTHYRRPIEFTDEVLANSKKALSVYTRLFERVGRLGGTIDSAPQAIDAPADGQYAANVAGYETKFFEAMDDDFNTAGAIAALHELAGEVNSFIERSGVEKSKDARLIAAASAGAGKLRNLAQILGLFRVQAAATAAAQEQPGIVDGLMQLLIDLRADARKTKNFATADTIRQRLTALGITLEDRADGTTWRKD